MYATDRSVLRAFAGAVALALAMVSAGGGCSSGSSSPTVVDIDPELGTNDPSVVVALGDSITFGAEDIGVEDCDESNRGAGGFCPPLQSLTGKTVRNEGICGEDSYGGVNRITQVMRRWRPGVILIDYSPNDLFNGTEAVISNLRIMIDAARKNHTVPVLGTLTPATGDHTGWNPFIVSVNLQIRALCAEQGLECADHYMAFKSDPGFTVSPYALLSEDGLHPNHAGYALMAKTWRWPLLRVY